MAPGVPKMPSNEVPESFNEIYKMGGQYDFPFSGGRNKDGIIPEGVYTSDRGIKLRAYTLTSFERANVDPEQIVLVQIEGYGVKPIAAKDAVAEAKKRVPDFQKHCAIFVPVE